MRKESLSRVFLPKVLKPGQRKRQFFSESESAIVKIVPFPLPLFLLLVCSHIIKIENKRLASSRFIV